MDFELKQFYLIVQSDLSRQNRHSSLFVESKTRDFKKVILKIFFCKLTVLFCDEVSEAFSIAQKNRNQLFFNKKGKKTIFKAFNWDCLM